MIIDFSQDPLTIPKPKTAFQEEVITFINAWFNPQTTVEVKTSGSTGTPKVFDIEKHRMLNSANMTCDFLRLKPSNTALLCLPVEYISGKMMIVRSIHQQLKLIIVEPSLQPLQNLNENVDFCAMTPLQVTHSLDKIHLVKNLIIGGAAVPESLKKQIKENHQSEENKIYETYGMSETLSHIALKEIFPVEEDYFSVFPGIEISADERGCLKISAPQLHPEKLQTNDIVEIKEERQFKFLGRADNIINSGGAKIFPEELENIVKKFIPNEVVFLGQPDDTLGQKLVAVIEEGEENAKAFIRNQMSAIHFEKSFHRPKKVIFIPEIPRTPNGKVDRRALSKLI